MQQVQQGDLRAAWNEIERLWEENRLLREKVARNWELEIKRSGPGVAVYNSINISILNITWTVLTFDSERRDDAGFHSVLANTSRLTVPTGYAGWYSIWGNIYWAAPPTSYLCIRYNGGPFISAEIIGNTACQAVSTTAPYYLNDSDYVELSVWQNSGGALNVAANPNYSPEFRMVRV